MQTAQPTAGPMGILLLVVAIYLVVKSPKKLQTLGRMGIAFVVTALLIMVTGAILRRRPIGPGSHWRIGGAARGGDCGVVAHAFSQTGRRGNA